MSNYGSVKYHITDKGSEECGASVRRCPYAEKGIILEHFDTKTSGRYQSINRNK